MYKTSRLNSHNSHQHICSTFKHVQLTSQQKIKKKKHQCFCMNMPWSCNDTVIGWRPVLQFWSTVHKQTKSLPVSLLYRSIHFLHANVKYNFDAWCSRTCLRIHHVVFLLLVMKSVLFCFAYNCKNTVRLNSTINFPFIIYLKKVKLYRTHRHYTIIIRMCTPILGKKQSTINSYIYSFFLFTYKSLGHTQTQDLIYIKLECTVLIFFPFISLMPHILRGPDSNAK